MITSIDNAIEKYTTRHEEYPTTLKITEKEYEKLKIEVVKELEDVGRKIKGDLTDFRGCKIIISPKITKFIVM